MAVKKRWETAARNPLAEQIQKQRDGAGEVLLERLEADLADSSRYEIVASLKELENAGRGQFLVGRKGQKSRFVWAAAKPVPEKTSTKPVPEKASTRLAPEKASAGKASAKPSKADAKARPSVDRELSGDAAASLASEPSPKGVTRKVLVPTVRRLERPKLSAHELPEPLSRPPARAPSASLQHSFHLRPGVLVTIELPENVSTSEVERLCGFLKSIPFAHHPRG
jgi:hypothetical protein